MPAHCKVWRPIKPQSTASLPDTHNTGKVAQQLDHWLLFRGPWVWFPESRWQLATICMELPLQVLWCPLLTTMCTAPLWYADQNPVDTPTGAEMDPVPSSISPAELPLVFHPAVPVTQLSSHSAPLSTPQPLNSVSKSAQASYSIRNKQTKKERKTKNKTKHR